MNINSRKVLIIGALLSFLTNSFGPLPVYAQELALPAPGQMVALSPAFSPAVLKGIKLDPQNPFRFHFFVDRGDSSLSQEELKSESSKLIKYFLASLTIPEKDLWVNLSPYEKDRIVPQEFGQTEMGRDLLAEDYLLKQITASLIYPESQLGKEFWAKVYAQAQAKYGTTNIPINTFNKVWIVPEKAVVYENGGVAFVLENHLKVMLEQDYLSLEKHSAISNNPVILSEAKDLKTSLDSSSLRNVSQNDVNALGSQIVREIVIPALTKEVNEGKNFAQLRQVFYSLILATWYKKKIKDSILNKVYSNRNKIGGVNVSVGDKDEIYQEYLKAFKKGVYNYIKEEADPVTNEVIPKKYFSGGIEALRIDVDLAMVGPRQLSDAQRSALDSAQLVDAMGDFAMINQTPSPKADVVMTPEEIAERINSLLKNREALTLEKKRELHDLIARANTITAETYTRLESQYRKQREAYPKGKDLESLQAFINRARDSNNTGPINILDIGTGIRDMRWFANQQNLLATGVDISPSVIESIKTELGNKPNITARVMDMNALSFQDNSFDGVRSWTSLHHLPLVDESEGMDVAVKEMYRVLKPGGKCDILVKAETNDRKGFMTLDTKEGLGSRFYYFLSRSDLLDLLQRNGFAVQDSDIEPVVDDRGELNWFVHAIKPTVSTTKKAETEGSPTADGAMTAQWPETLWQAIGGEGLGRVKNMSPIDFGTYLSRRFDVPLIGLDREAMVRSGLSTKFPDDMFALSQMDYEKKREETGYKTMISAGILGPGVYYDKSSLMTMSIIRLSSEIGFFHEFCEYLAAAEGQADPLMLRWHGHHSLAVVIETLRFAQKLGRLNDILESWKGQFEAAKHLPDYPEVLKKELEDVYRMAEKGEFPAIASHPKSKAESILKTLKPKKEGSVAVAVNVQRRVYDLPLRVFQTAKFIEFTEEQTGVIVEVHQAHSDQPEANVKIEITAVHKDGRNGCNPEILKNIAEQFGQFLNDPSVLRGYPGSIDKYADEVQRLGAQNLLWRKKSEKDKAQTTGGIDLNPAQMFMQVKKQGSDFKFEFNGQIFDAAQITGATFTIRQMTPVINLPLILGLKKEPEMQLSRLN